MKLERFVSPQVHCIVFNFKKFHCFQFLFKKCILNWIFFVIWVKQKTVFFLQPTCFGFEYLTALEAYDKETDGADLETLRGSLSDMLSMKLSTQITDILETCSEGKQESEAKVLSKFFLFYFMFGVRFWRVLIFCWKFWVSLFVISQ